MKNLLCLLALLAVASLAARAQSAYTVPPTSQVAINQRMEEANRQQNLRTAQQLQNQNNQATTTDGTRGPLLRKPNYLGYFSGRNAEERRAHRQAKASGKAYKADQKAHNGWKSYPGGYRGKNGQIMRPDGTIVGGSQTAQPAARKAAPKTGTINGRTEADDLKALEKYQDFDKWKAAREKEQAKSGN